MEQRTPQANGMAVAAMILGIISVPTVCCLGFGIPIAATGIIFALLSKRGHRMNTQAQIGFGLSLGSLIISIVTIAALIISTCMTPEFQNVWNEIKDVDLSQFEDQQEMQDFLQDIIDEHLAIPEETPAYNYEDSLYPDMPFYDYEEYFSQEVPIL